MDGFDLIIFDCDGVLVDSEIIAADVESSLLREIGIDIPRQAFAERYAGLAWKDILLAVEKDTAVPIPASLIDRSTELLDERLAREVRPVAGAGEAAIAIPLPRAICSNSAPERLETMLKRTRLHHLFDPHIFSAKTLGENRQKPAPDIYIHGARTLGHAPSRIVVVEDSVHGVHAARAAGMRVIGFTGGSHSYPDHADHLSEAGAETVVNRMQHLPATVAALSQWNAAV